MAARKAACKGAFNQYIKKKNTQPTNSDSCNNTGNELIFSTETFDRII